jgi:hypothetical protein
MVSFLRVVGILFSLVLTIGRCTLEQRKTTYAYCRKVWVHRLKHLNSLLNVVLEALSSALRQRAVDNNVGSHPCALCIVETGVLVAAGPITTTEWHIVGPVLDFLLVYTLRLIAKFPRCVPSRDR